MDIRLVKIPFCRGVDDSIIYWYSLVQEARYDSLIELDANSIQPMTGPIGLIYSLNLAKMDIGPEP